MVTFYCSILFFKKPNFRYDDGDKRWKEFLFQFFPHYFHSNFINTRVPFP